MAIAQTYNPDETNIRIMNADGARWVKNICEADTVFQSDQFHRNKAIKENIPYPQAADAVHELLNQHDADGMFDYIEIYKNSLDEEEEIEKGLVYRNMGTMENHVWSIIAKRMKHNHTCWSIKGGNNLAKILAKKCSGKLNEVVGKLKMSVFGQEAVGKTEADILTAGQTKKKAGKGYEYPCKGSLIYLYETVEGKAHQVWKYLAGI